MFIITNLPLIIINTENSLEPETKTTYINSQIIIINDNKNNINQTASIKPRGQPRLCFLKNNIKKNLAKNMKY